MREKITVAFLADAPNSGKTTASIGLARCLSNQGVVVAPLKAVSVVHEADDVAFAGVQPSRWGMMHNVAAARAWFEPWHNPITVVLEGAAGKSGELLVLGRSYGRVPVAGRDCVDVSSMAPAQARACREAVHLAIGAAQSDKHEVVVVEGAGGVGVLNPEDDLSNVIVPQALNASVVFVCNVKAPRSPAEIDRPAQLCTRWGIEVRGFVLNQVADDRTPHLPRTIPLLGAIAETPDLDDYDGSPAQLEFLYERAANAVTRSGLLGQIVSRR